MKDRNKQLKDTLGKIAAKEVIEEIHDMPQPDTINREDHPAYSVSDEFKLLSMLNTLKLEPQFYRTEDEIITELRDLIEKIALTNPYFVAQAIVYSRCMRDGMRSINHLAAALLAPFASGSSWGSKFYSTWHKQDSKGGCIYRLDDMSEIKDIFSALNSSKLTNAMKKGFAQALIEADTYTLAKYKKTTIDISNLVHPDSSKSKAEVEIDNKTFKTLDAIMQGKSISADTWESANSEAGQIIAQAVKEGKISKEEGDQYLREAKSMSWESLLKEGKLGILAALRNIVNILEDDPLEITIIKLCNLLSDEAKLKQGKIMPYQIDIAYERLQTECNRNKYFNQVKEALEEGIQKTISNLSEILTGKNLVILDCSASMTCRIDHPRIYTNTSCISKASLIASMIALAGNADIIRFGSRADYFYNKYNKLAQPIEILGRNVFDLAYELKQTNYGATNLASAFNLIKAHGKHYDRIFILSDNACNHGNQIDAYKDLIRTTNSPYIYSIDLASYGTYPLPSTAKVNYYYGYGYGLFDDIVNKEFNPSEHIEKVKQIII